MKNLRTSWRDYAIVAWDHLDHICTVFLTILVLLWVTPAVDRHFPELVQIIMDHFK